MTERFIFIKSDDNRYSIIDREKDITVGIIYNPKMALLITQYLNEWDIKT